jgi:hypothetical protein
MSVALRLMAMPCSALLTASLVPAYFIFFITGDVSGIHEMRMILSAGRPVEIEDQAPDAIDATSSP